MSGVSRWFRTCLLADVALRTGVFAVDADGNRTSFLAVNRQPSTVPLQPDRASPDLDDLTSDEDVAFHIQFEEQCGRSSYILALRNLEELRH